jgi:hypothetical protein
MTSIDPSITKEVSTSTDLTGALPAKRATHCAWLPRRCRIVPNRFEDFALFQLLLLANAAGTTCHQLAPRGKLAVPLADLVQELRGYGFRLLRSTDTSGTPPQDECDRYLVGPLNREVVLVHPSGYVDIDPHRGRPLHVISVDERQTDSLREKLGAWLRPAFDRDAGGIYMLKANPEGVHFTQIGTAGRALRRENYAAETLREVDHVAHDIEAAEPCGRLALLTGPTGTGKTHLIRSMIAAAKRPRFVVLQPGDLRTMLAAGPIGALAEFANDEAEGRPIVLIVEDADDCLVPRGSDNMSLIAVLLNLSDGIIGSTFDIRVLVTTNARHTEIDPAILRPGRLCRHVEVPALHPDHATDLLRSLLGAEPRAPFRKPVTLAEVYAAAHERPREA